MFLTSHPRLNLAPSHRPRPHSTRSSPLCVSATPPSSPTPPATSLIPQSLDELQSDSEFQAILAQIEEKGQAALTAEEATRRDRSLSSLGLPSFATACAQNGVPPLIRGPTQIFQLNIGLYCNQACRHCHVESSPLRTAEQMTLETAQRCVELFDATLNSNNSNTTTITTVDITGGAPELNPHFRYLVEAFSSRGVQVIDRCNLTVLCEPGQEDTAEFLAKHRVRVVASLPCYSKSNVDAQRGGGVFARSIAGLQQLNALGYGVPGTGLVLDLVYNPNGVFLAPPQASLEDSYRRELKEAFGVEFTSLLCLNNMPIKRWADELIKRGQLEEYMSLLVNAFNPAAAGAGLMCRNTVSVDWQGRIFDCDFNQQLDIPLMVGGREGGSGGKKWQNKKTIFELSDLNEVVGAPIAVASHCYGCTAGAGSSCQGATS